MTSFLHGLRIRTKLTLMVLIMMALTLGILFLVYDHYETVLVDMVQNQTEDLSKALEVSVQQLTSKGQNDQQLLQDYVGRLSALGVTEISILSSERRVVASSNQARVGTRIHPPKKGPSGPFIITGTIGEDEDLKTKISYNLDIPIIVDDQKRGYVRLHVILDDFAALLRSIYLKRSLATSGVFLAGVGASLALAYRMTSPLKRLTVAAEQVAAGDLDVTVPVERGDEIGQLQGNFNRMLEALREKRRLEVQLRRAERAGAMGRLASAVAHEIRNPLNYVGLSVDHLQASFRPSDPQRRAEFDRSVGLIKEEMRRVNSLVTEFLDFGRPPRLRIQACRSEEILQEVMRLAAPRAEQQKVAMELRVEPGLPSLRADPEGLRTCFLNLVTNGIQAMPRGGAMELRAETAVPGQARFRVRDSGVGIAARDLERIFEPYFSTKEAGVGLGLAITQRIVQDHGGRIEVSSLPGGGTEFQILLPVDGPPRARRSGRWARRHEGEPMSRGMVLVVDDEPRQLDILRTILVSEGYEAETCQTGEQALRILRTSAPHVLLTDLKMPGMNGITLLEEAQREAPGCSAIVMTAHGTVDTAVEAMKKGAFDYLAKPLERDRLLLVLERAMETVRLRRENRSLRAQLRDRFRLENIIGQHGSMQDVFRLVQKIAPSSATVLIYGESGTGKELIARALHFNSPRASRPFLGVNCSAIPEPLLESELFGHEKGSFTGAIARKPGLFEQAHLGTLLLDEVGDLPSAMQAKILRAIQEKEIRRVGGEASIVVDVRIVAATNKNLALQMKEGKFREDLYYRLNVLPIFLPPLRDRSTDIPGLVEHFVGRFARGADKTPPRVAPQTLSALMRYRWPGNVRQLESVLERAVLLAEGDELGPELLPPEVRENVSSPLSGLEIDIPDEGISLEAVERELLEKAVRKAGGTLTRAARLLGISSRTLQYRLEKFGIARAIQPAPSGEPPEPNGASRIGTEP